MKKDFGVKTWLCPMPVLMVATFNEDGSPNVMTAAWGGTGGEELLTVCVDNTHKTWMTRTVDLLTVAGSCRHPIPELL